MGIIEKLHIPGFPGFIMGWMYGNEINTDVSGSHQYTKVLNGCQPANFSIFVKSNNTS
jgi:hypothetical protein